MYRFGLAYKNALCMLSDRGFRIDSELRLKNPYEIFQRIYETSMDLKCSLGDAAHLVVTHTKDPSRTLHFWCLDRNFDILKQKERMISTDQIKYLQDLIENLKGSFEHLLVSPNKLSPQAKKELQGNIQLFLFDDLLIRLPKHELAIEHIPVTEDYLKSILGHTIQKTDLPILPVEDPMVKWYAWPKGTILFLKNPVMPSFRIVQ